LDINSKARKAYFRQDYGSGTKIEGVEIIEIRRFNDDGGAITELGRLKAGMHAQLQGFEVKQFNYSEIDPGAIKAFHMHERQTDVWYVPPDDKLLLVLHDARSGSSSENATMRIVLGDGNNQLIRIPPGVAHGCRNLSGSKGRIIYMVDVQFSIDDDCDEGRLPWDYLGEEVWEVVKG